MQHRQNRRQVRPFIQSTAGLARTASSRCNLVAPRRAKASGIRQSFLGLKDLKDPIMRDYYLSAFRKSRGSHSTSVRKRIRHEILGGVTREVVRLRADGCVIAFAQINLRIRQGHIRLNHGDKVHLQGFLTPGLNPNLYATGVTSGDPARRLSLQLTGESQEPYEDTVH